MHTGRANGSNEQTDDIQFQIGDDLGSDHLPIEVSIDALPHKNLSTNHTIYRFDQTEREVFESTLEAVLGSLDFSGLHICHQHCSQ